MTRGLPGLLALAALVWVMTGLMVVEPDEVAVITRFGAVDRTAQAGLGLRAPWPIEADERVFVTQSRQAAPGARRLLTGDTNLVDLELAVQYVVGDPVAWVTGLQDPDAAVAAEALAAATELIATLEVDVLLTTGRAALEQGIQRRAQLQLDAFEAGVRLTSIEVRELAPPPAVVDAFNDVSSARGDRETLALSADAYASQVVPDARGQASRTLEEAQGAATVRTQQAQADVARFVALAAVETAAPAATRLELQQRALEQIGPRVEVVVAHPGTEVVLPAPEVSVQP